MKFNYSTEIWESKEFELPFFNSDYVLLTPKDILTKEDIWINKHDLLNDYDRIANSVDNVQLRAQINNYLLIRLSKYKKPTQKQRKEALTKVLEKYPKSIVLFVAHNAINKAMIRFLRKWHPEDRQPIPQGNTSISIFKISEKERKEILFNCTKHID